MFVELELAFIMAACEGRVVWMILLQVFEVVLRFCGGVATVLTNVHLKNKGVRYS